MISITLNIIYIFIILIAIYYGITKYIQTRHKTIIRGLCILLFSLILEIQRINLGNYLIDTTDAYRTIRDIARTILMISGFSILKSNPNTTKKKHK